MSPSAVECTSEWVEKLKYFEEAEVKRLDLHSEWKGQTEEMTLQQTVGTNVPTDEQVPSDQEKFSEGRVELNKKSLLNL